MTSRNERSPQRSHSDARVLRRWQYSLWHLVVLVTLCCVACGLWIYLRRPDLSVAVSPSSEPEARSMSVAEAQQEFPLIWFPPAFKAERAVVKSAFVIRGRMPRGWKLRWTLYLIDNGSVQELASRGRGWTAGQLGSTLKTVSYTVYVVRLNSSDSQAALLQLRGPGAGAGVGGFVEHDEFRLTHTRVLQGPIAPHKTYLAYVAGDRAPTVERQMTLQQFAGENQGTYYVITVRVE